MNSPRRPVIFLMGATATGKTDVAVHLFKHLPVEIISVDSAMVYRQMNIGTAKPSAELLREVPHRLIDIRDPANTYSAAEFRDDALQALAEIDQADRIPLLVGGTGLYFRTLQYGISDLPEANQAIRKQLDAQRQQYGSAWLHDRLKSIDPEAAQRIHPNDPQRIQRALEVYEISGRPMSQHFDANPGETLQRPVIKLILTPTDREHHRRIVGQRFDLMLQQGLVEEVRALYQREDLTATLPAMRMVGYRQIWRYLAGEFGYEDMRKHAIIATQQLAKRQFTWLRKEQDFHSIAAEDTKKAGIILDLLRERADITAL